MISCVITTYKRPIVTLKRALDSVINQTYQDIEIILINDAPSEKDLDQEIRRLISSYKKPIIYIVNNTNQGACVSRNKGISISKGEYIAFLDDDDEWLPNKLKKQLYRAESSRAALVYCSYYTISEQNKIRMINAVPQYKDLSHFENLLIYNYIGSTSFPLIRSDILKGTNGFNQKLKASQDHELWLRITRNNHIEYCNEPLVNYYYSHNSITSDWNKRTSGFECIWHEFINDYNKNKYIANLRLNHLAIAGLKSHKFIYFIKTYIKAILLYPTAKANLMFLKKILNKVRG